MDRVGAARTNLCVEEEAHQERIDDLWCANVGPMPTVWDQLEPCVRKGGDNGLGEPDQCDRGRTTAGNPCLEPNTQAPRSRWDRVRSTHGRGIAALFVDAPWRSSPGFLDRAQAALTPPAGSVVHMKWDVTRTSPEFGCTLTIGPNEWGLTGHLRTSTASSTPTSRHEAGSTRARPPAQQARRPKWTARANRRSR
jgi:hypothetical protein